MDGADVGPHVAMDALGALSCVTVVDERTKEA